MTYTVLQADELSDIAAALTTKQVRRKGKPQPEQCSGFDAAELLAMDMPDPRYLCRPWLSEGVSLIVGRPKIGKTTLLRQAAVQGNAGGRFLDADCASAEVLFLSLEEGPRLMRSKLKAMKLRAEHLKGIRLEFEWPQGQAGVTRIREWLQARTDKGRMPVVIVDSLTRFRMPPPERGMTFAADYEAVKMLADLAKEFPGLVVLVLHHTTKAMPDDPVAAISGTYGLTAAADNYLILLKQGQKFRLHCGGRLWASDDADFELVREAGAWTLGGHWSFGAESVPPKQAQVLELLQSGAKTAAAIAKLTGQEDSAARHMLAAMERKGLVRRIANGWELVR